MSIDDRARWEQRYQQRPPLRAPSPLLARIRPHLPPPGALLDIASGPGPDTPWWQAQGWAVTLADISPTALARARAAFPGVQTHCLDLEDDPIPTGPWDLIVCQSYLQRGLFAPMAAALRVGGGLLFSQPTVTNLERNARPSRRFLIERGEAARLVAGAGLAVAARGEEWGPDGRHVGWVVGIKKAKSPTG